MTISNKCMYQISRFLFTEFITIRTKVALIYNPDNQLFLGKYHTRWICVCYVRDISKGQRWSAKSGKEWLRMICLEGRTIAPPCKGPRGKKKRCFNIIKIMLLELVTSIWRCKYVSLPQRNCPNVSLAHCWRLGHLGTSSCLWRHWTNWSVHLHPGDGGSRHLVFVLEWCNQLWRFNVWRLYLLYLN